MSVCTTKTRYVRPYNLEFLSIYRKYSGQGGDTDMTHEEECYMEYFL